MAATVGRLVTTDIHQWSTPLQRGSKAILQVPHLHTVPPHEAAHGFQKVHAALVVDPKPKPQLVRRACRVGGRHRHPGRAVDARKMLLRNRLRC